MDNVLQHEAPFTLQSKSSWKGSGTATTYALCLHGTEWQPGSRCGCNTSSVSHRLLTNPVQVDSLSSPYGAPCMVPHSVHKRRVCLQVVLVLAWPCLHVLDSLLTYFPRTVASGCATGTHPASSKWCQCYFLLPLCEQRCPRDQLGGSLRTCGCYPTCHLKTTPCPNSEVRNWPILPKISDSHQKVCMHWCVYYI